MAASIKMSVYTNSDDAFVAWAPSEFIPGARGFLLERERKTDQGQKVEIVENRVGFARDNPRSGDHRPSNEWPFQRFNWTDHSVVVTGSHNFSASASEKNDENLVIIRGQKKLAMAYAAYVMSVYQHYRFRSYVRETLEQGKKPWSYLDDNDKWLKDELRSKAQEIAYWAG